MALVEAKPYLRFRANVCTVKLRAATVQRGRAYSDTLFSGLLGEFKEEHLDLLISPHLKNLDIRHVEKKLIQGIANRLKADGSGIHTVKARFSKLLYEHLIPSLSQLVDIEIGGFRGICAPHIHGIYTSEMIKSLGRYCPVLRVLKLRDDTERFTPGRCLLSENVKLSPKLYEAVCYLLDRCPCLEILENINTVEILYKKHLLDLQNNDLENCKKYSLTKLSFCNCRYYPLLDAFKMCFSLCPKVTCIELYRMDADQLVICSDFEELQDVKIAFWNVTIADTNRFLMLRGSKLVNLKLFYPCISVQTLIRCCPELKYLTLSAVNEFEPVKPEDFLLCATGFSKLKSFCIHLDRLSKERTADVVKLIIYVAKNLHNVDFRCIRDCSEEFCNSIFELGFHRVLELDVSHSNIPVSFLIKLLMHGSLKKLNVWYCNNISDEDGNNLLRFKQANQTVNVKCTWDKEEFYAGSCDEWKFSDLGFYRDYDSDLGPDTDTD